jgi:outer membrane protein assembly factor BamA
LNKQILHTLLIGAGKITILLLFTTFSVTAQKNYALQVLPAELAEATEIKGLNLRTDFPNRAACTRYIEELPELLHTKGYITSSQDSIVYDSTAARIWLYLGKKYTWSAIRVNEATDSALKAMRINLAQWQNRSAKPDELYRVQQRILAYYQERGYPFTKISLDSVQITGEQVTAVLNTNKGIIHRIDSIRVNGKARVSTSLLQRHLNIPNGSIYKKSTLDAVGKKIIELPYIQQTYPPDLTMLGGSSVLNVYLQPRKSSQVNILLGIIPAPTPVQSPQQKTKLLVTGDANILLNNSLGAGETIGLTYQKLALGAPRLNLLYRHPYIFRSAFGAEFAFEMYKRDSAYLNLDVLAGVRYQAGAYQAGRVFFQHQKTNAYPDTAVIKAIKKLPDNLDVKIYNIGVGYEFNNTDYRRNPGKGNELGVTVAFGTKKIIVNPGITALKDLASPGFNFASLYDSIKTNTFQFKLKTNAAHYFRAGKTSVLKTAINGGVLLSQNYLRNELFQLGGYKLLRGFDEESIFAAQYLVGTAEYRYRLPGPDSYFFGFTDFGYAQNKLNNQPQDHFYIGAGLGLTFATKAGLFNVSLAAGKRDDLQFGFKQTKIHFGYINLF